MTEEKADRFWLSGSKHVPLVVGRMIYPHAHLFISTNPYSGHEGSKLSEEAQTSLSTATSSSSSGRESRLSPAKDIIYPVYPDSVFLFTNSEPKKKC